MSFVADLHIHSHLSRATSKQCNLEGLQYWAQLKGVRVVGTGDFTHPTWFEELNEKLVPSAPGLFRLREDLAETINPDIPSSCKAPVDFVITGEISSIYKRDGCVRKVHSVLLLPDLETAGAINQRLDALGNIKSDGRPILGLDPRIILEIALEANPDACLIPAHIWTPWFSMLGSKSGFDSPRECFGDLMEHIFAVETGLSSDPPMNWRVSELDELTLVSNSDLHSPANLARNANVFHCQPDFFSIRDALRSGSPEQCGGTIDMFPEEGKYHFDGHRKCGVCMEPEESLAHDCLCPVCGKPLVLGVLHRIVELADRPKGGKPETALPCEHIIPLSELLAEIFDCGPKTKKVNAAYHKLLAQFGSELHILRERDPADFTKAEPDLLAEALHRLRQGCVIRNPGYDGEYGKIHVFAPGDKDALRKQGVFFAVPEETTVRESSQPWPTAQTEAGDAAATREYTLRRPGHAAQQAPEATATAPTSQLDLFATQETLAGLTPDQKAAVDADDRAIVIVAGPGTGKTRTLTRRIAHLISRKQVDPSTVLAVTFTNRAAREMRERLEALLGHNATHVTVSTFHSLALRILREDHSAAGLPRDFGLIDQDGCVHLLRAATSLSAKAATNAVEEILKTLAEQETAERIPYAAELSAALEAHTLVPLDTLIPRCLSLLQNRPDIVEKLGFLWLCVDEYQDVNKAQYDLVRIFADAARSVYVIGDPDQAIYGFRGADVAYFLRFTEDFPDARVVQLEHNFRSSGTIVAAASQVMTPGRSTMSVAAESVLEAGVRIRFHGAPTAAAEAEFVTHEIEKWLGGTALFSVDSSRVAGDASTGDVSLADIAILVRLRALIPPLQKALERLGLPVQAVGDEAFVETAGARTLINALRTWSEAAPDAPAGTALAEFAQSDGARQLPAEAKKALQVCRNLAAEDRGNLAAFLDRLLLRRTTEQYDARAEKITILTMHAAKGLEFPVVFVTGCEQGLMPYVKPGEEACDLEEERRLLYVAMTRAKEVLYLTSTRKRTLFGATEERAPSPFLDEIQEALRDRLIMPRRKQRPSATQLEFTFG